MVDRIEKTERFEYWQVRDTAETHKDREQKEDNGKDAFQSFQEKTDWQLLFDKTQLWNKNVQLTKDEIEKIIFKKMNLKTDPSLLRVNIILKGGGLMNPAFLAISRQVALTLKTLKTDDIIPLETLTKDNVLRITVPRDPQSFLKEEEQLRTEEKKSAPPASRNNEGSTTGIHPAKQTGNILQTLNILNTKTHRIKKDILTIYAIALVVFVLFVWGLILIF
ncbi:MAG TPA: hypothetical protein DDW49_09890 [Deltaproteobacteria bacterium]|nr:MAG: hypothetical protein A2048_01630 [Deltaproteobacteria bacterium GWA2_45_12]HBF13674.1 hypothetical protein [Deltaproteobacteria bacterium]